MITGLITRVIFVKPSWDKNNTDMFSKAVLEVGLLSINNSNQPTYGACLYVPLQAGRVCMYIKPPMTIVDFDDVGEFKVRHFLHYLSLG